MLVSIPQVLLAGVATLYRGVLVDDIGKGAVRNGVLMRDPLPLRHRSMNSLCVKEILSTSAALGLDS